MIIQSYNDICLEIDGLEERIEDIRTSIGYYQKLIHKDAPKEMSGMIYSDMPKGNHNYMSLDRIYEAIGKCESHLYLAEDALKCKKESKQRIEAILGQLEGLEYKVFFMHKCCRMPLKAVAKELGYSYEYMKEVSSNASEKVPTKSLLTP